MRYKCHYCGEFLKPGLHYTLECECGNCNLGFEKTGQLDCFQVAFFEKGKDIFLFKSKHDKNIFYGFKKYSSSLSKIGPFSKSVYAIPEIILQVDTALQFDEEGVPQIYKLWEKLDKLKVFS
jgi:hypothetical protein